VTLRSTLPMPEVVIDQDRWTTIVAVGAGATVRRIGDELCLGELPISRAVKELVEIGLVDIAATPPAGAVPMSTSSAPLPTRAPLAPKPSEVPEPPAPSTANGARARRTKAATPAPPETFVPLDLPGHNTPAPSYDDRPATASAVTPGTDPDFAASFPGLAATATVTEEDEELAKQLATLSPRAANAIRAAAEATTDEERQAALEGVDGEDEPLNRGLLLKFLSSVKS
jgi:hypothetical protein